MNLRTLSLWLAAALILPAHAGLARAGQAPDAVGGVGMQASEATPPSVGGDRDGHGCIPSAGYAWCEAESACVRWWELAADKGLPREPAAVAAYCTPPAR